jgi:hypothetical protein
MLLFFCYTPPYLGPHHGYTSVLTIVFTNFMQDKIHTLARATSPGGKYQLLGLRFFFLFRVFITSWRLRD